MIRYHGYYWPDMADANVMRYIHHADDMRVALRHVKGRAVAVQAGGHCGIWPLWLAKHFKKVYTFEPEPENFACLKENCGDSVGRKIFAMNACLGREPTKIKLARNGKNTGGHKGTQEPGDTPVVTIDGLQLVDACDLIVLDIEGMELPALQGAKNTIKQFRPVLMLEDRGHGDRYGWGGAEKLHAWLAEMGYRDRAHVSYDRIWTPT